MRITRQQEIALWKLLAESLNLEHEEDGIYVGNCPFCYLQDVFGVDTENSYAGCTRCGKEAYSLGYCLRLLRTSSPVLDLG